VFPQCKRLERLEPELHSSNDYKVPPLCKVEGVCYKINKLRFRARIAWEDMLRMDMRTVLGQLAPPATGKGRASPILGLGLTMEAR